MAIVHYSWSVQPHLLLQNFCATQRVYHDRIIAVRTEHRSMEHDNTALLCVRHGDQDLNVYHILRNASTLDANRSPATAFVQLQRKKRQEINVRTSMWKRNRAMHESLLIMTERHALTTKRSVTSRSLLLLLLRKPNAQDRFHK